MAPQGRADPIAIINELQEMAFFCLTIPEEYGGFGLVQSLYVLFVSEELSRGYIVLGLWGHAREIAAVDHRGREQDAERKMAPRICER